MEQDLYFDTIIQNIFYSFAERNGLINGYVSPEAEKELKQKLIEIYEGWDSKVKEHGEK